MTLALFKDYDAGSKNWTIIALLIEPANLMASTRTTDRAERQAAIDMIHRHSPVRVGG